MASKLYNIQDRGQSGKQFCTIINVVFSPPFFIKSSGSFFHPTGETLISAVTTAPLTASAHDERPLPQDGAARSFRSSCAPSQSALHTLDAPGSEDCCAATGSPSSGLTQTSAPSVRMCGLIRNFTFIFEIQHVLWLWRRLEGYPRQKNAPHSYIF